LVVSQRLSISLTILEQFKTVKYGGFFRFGKTKIRMKNSINKSNPLVLGGFVCHLSQVLKNTRSRVYASVDGKTNLARENQFHKNSIKHRCSTNYGDDQASSKTRLIS
jgi:hypothetical protein